MIEDPLEKIHERLSDELLIRTIGSHRRTWNRLGYKVCETCHEHVPQNQLLVYSGHTYHLQCAPENEYTSRLKQLL